MAFGPDLCSARVTLHDWASRKSVSCNWNTNEVASVLIFKKGRKKNSIKSFITFWWKVMKIFLLLRFPGTPLFDDYVKLPSCSFILKVQLTVIQNRLRIHENGTEVSSNGGWAMVRMPCATARDSDAWGGDYGGAGGGEKDKTVREKVQDPVSV